MVLQNIYLIIIHRGDPIYTNHMNPQQVSISFILFDYFIEIEIIVSKIKDYYSFIYDIYLLIIIIISLLSSFTFISYSSVIDIQPMAMNWHDYC